MLYYRILYDNYIGTPGGVARNVVRVGGELSILIKYVFLFTLFINLHKIQRSTQSMGGGWVPIALRPPLATPLSTPCII